MNSYVGMTMVSKEQEQDDYFSQQSVLLTLPANLSRLTISRIVRRLMLNVKSMLCRSITLNSYDRQ